MNSKKSSLFFLPLLVIVTLIILVNLYIVILNKNGLFDMPIGKRQMDLINAYGEGESALFYIDQSSKYSLQQAIYELAQNGGISEYNAENIFSGHKCGKIKDANVWYRLEMDGSSGVKKEACFNDSLPIGNLEYYFNNNLNLHLNISPYKIPINNYDYEVSGSLEIVGMAMNPLKFDIKNKK